MDCLWTGVDDEEEEDDDDTLWSILDSSESLSWFFLWQSTITVINVHGILSRRAKETLNNGQNHVVLVTDVLLLTSIKRSNLFPNNFSQKLSYHFVHYCSQEK